MGNSSIDKVEDATAKSSDDLLPVTLLCGFLGAGKTTMMKHILETKHVDPNFKCAVIVNDMAALNIDKSLIDQSALVQSDEVVAMQNGCFCCTLQSDLVDQILELVKKQKFNYMLIEASGVSEPAQIAPLFELHDHDDDDPEMMDHEHDPDKPQLGEVARLDTCVTVVDSAEFYSNLDSMDTFENGETMGTIAELMMEQVEFSNVVVLNKGDLVSEEQQRDIMDKIFLINPRAKIVKTIQSRVDIKSILNTRLYADNIEQKDFMVEATQKAELDKATAETVLEDCCQVSVAANQEKCCTNKRMRDSGLSEITLSRGFTGPDQGEITRHEARFGITSFIFTSRRPFHPQRLEKNIILKYFVAQFLDFMDDDDNEDGDEKETTEEDIDDEDDDDGEKSEDDMTEEERKKWEDKQKRMEAEKEERLKELQARASEKAKQRRTDMGELLRSKGFLWVASTHNVMGGWQQAGNVIRLEAEDKWMCEDREFWEDNEEVAKLVYKDIKKPNGEEWEYGDRRQELVFIGQALRHEFIQAELDKCLLTDQEMKLGPEGWEQTMGEVDRIKLSFPDYEDDEEDVEEQ